MIRGSLILTICVILLSAGRIDVCLDPGHGGADPGTVNTRHGANGPYEKDFNLYIANVCYDDLTWTLGYSVIMTRIGDTFVSREDRAKMANGEKVNPVTGTKDTCDVLVSIHNNGSADSTSRGTETWFCDQADSIFAHQVNSKMFNFISGMPYAYNRGLKRSGFEVIAKAKCQSCLTECAFVTHDISSTAQWYQLKENQSGFKDFIAYGIDDGIDAGYGFGPRPAFMVIIQFGSEKSGVGLVWGSSPASGVTGYNIYRRTHPASNYALIASNVPDTVFHDNNVVPEGTYSYYVRARRSNGKQSARSDIATCQVPHFSSSCDYATGDNTGQKIIYDRNGNACLAWTNQQSSWFALSTDHGTTWAPGLRIASGWQPSLFSDTTGSIGFCHISTLGDPDSAAQETLTYAIRYCWNENNVWHENVLYKTHDSILSLSFAVDSQDTAWIVFNTYDNDGNNRLWIGQFHMPTPPESLENITLLDTYVRHGVADIAVRHSDRSIWTTYERANAVVCRWRDANGAWQYCAIEQNARRPAISTAGNSVHFIWERYSPSTVQKDIRTSYTDGAAWARVQTIATVTTSQSYPYIADGSVAVWADLHQGRHDIFTSRRTLLGAWTVPQNISQTAEDSRYPQVTQYIAGADTHLIYVWTEGNVPPYKIRTFSPGDVKTNVETPKSNSCSITSNIVKETLKIKYNSVGTGRIKAQLYDITGRLIDTVVDADAGTGSKEYRYNCEHLSNGIYFLHVMAPEQSATHKLVLCR